MNVDVTKIEHVANKVQITVLLDPHEVAELTVIRQSKALDLYERFVKIAQLFVAEERG